MLHIQGLANGQQGIKECIECWAGEAKCCGADAVKNGTFTCCVAGTCPTEKDADMMTTEYKMSMKLSYTRDVHKVQPVDVETYLTPNCSYEYNAVPEHPGAEVHLARQNWTVDRDK